MATQAAREASRFRSRCVYDVFLSFRGEDTRQTFTDTLYKALVEAGLRTFKDDNEIERGENIKSALDRAIHQSKSSILVLSENYASSSWCLDELVMILENKNKGHAILPVSYHVDQSEVEKQRGGFEKAFDRHEEHFRAEAYGDDCDWRVRIEGWREALRKVVSLGGMSFHDDFDEGKELKFVEKVVNVIEDKINHSILGIAPYLIGLRVSTAKDQFVDSRVGICGMGGIGKTTIAKYVFNSNFEKFDGSSFLEDAGEIFESADGLLQLQKKFLSDILKLKIEIRSIDEGMKIIEHALKGKRVLLVLDGIDRTEQLDAILSLRDWFRHGSKVIITTRNVETLKARDVCKNYVVEPLNDSESIELFAWHAFGQAHPHKDHEELFERIVKHCGGLPLAIRVIGSSLTGKSVDVWESSLKKLQAIPNHQVSRKLRMSYELLQDDDDRNLFLDVACFFVKHNVNHVNVILEGCKFYSAIGIENLKARSLLSIERNNKILMHQLIRDMGREIVRQESPKQHGKRSRLWQYQDSFRVLNEKTGSNTIQGLNLSLHMRGNKLHKNIYNLDGAREVLLYFAEKVRQRRLLKERSASKRHGLGFLSGLTSSSSSQKSSGPNRVDIDADAFSRMQELRLLQVENIVLAGSLEGFPRKLRWLCWRRFPDRFIPDDFPLESLIVLEMRYSSLEHIWKRERLLKMLKILDLSHSSSLSRTHNFSETPNLERLILRYCISLIEVSESVGELKNLALLNLSGCKHLRILPRSISQLNNLERLDISFCSKLRWSPSELGEMKSLKGLIADETIINNQHSLVTKNNPLVAIFLSSMVKPASPPINHLVASLPRSLVTLSLTRCSLTSDAFPEDLSGLLGLQHLYLNGNPIRRLPESIKSLASLQSLELEQCEELESLPELPTCLNLLSVYKCISLQTLPSLPNLLTSLDLLVLHCGKLREIKGLFELKPIKLFDAEKISYLGLFDLELLYKAELGLYNNLSLRRRSLPIQGLYEFGIFSTSIPWSNIPRCFSYKSTRSSICFEVPFLPNLRVKALNVGFVHAYTRKKNVDVRNSFWNELHIRVANITKDLKWTYSPTFTGVPYVGEDVTWLSYWKIGDKLECGDKLKISVTLGSDGVELKEFGAHIVFEPDWEESEVDTQFNSWHVIDGVDISAYEIRNRCFFLCIHDFDIHQNCSVDDDGWSTGGWYDFLFGDSHETEDPDYLVTRIEQVRDDDSTSCSSSIMY